MTAPIGAPQQHKQPSRKGKKAWRKNIDITEVQSGLETLREEIIEGGPLTEKPAEELFALDTRGSEDIKRQYKIHKPLKVDEILSKRSAVPGVDSRTRKRSNDRLTDGVLEPVAKRQRKDWVSKKEVQRLKAVVASTSHLSSERFGEENHATNDLWADGGDMSVSESRDLLQDSEYIPKPQSKVAPSTLRRAPIAMTASGRPSKAVARPMAGTSYNPSFEEWDDLLNREGAAEIAAEHIRQTAAQQESERQDRIAAIARTDDKRSAYASAYAGGDDSAWEGFETEPEDQDQNLLKKRRPQRKTPAERNKIKRKKEAERLAKHEARMGDRRRQADQILSALLTQGNDQEEHDIAETVNTTRKQPQITDPTTTIVSTATSSSPSSQQELGRTITKVDSVSGDTKQNDLDLDLDDEEEDDEAGGSNVTRLRRRKLGTIPIPQQDLELVLPDELRESLRQLRPEGNLLRDRFRHLLVNGKIESRKPITQQSRKKKKVKMTEKWSYKDFSLPV